MKRRHEKSLKKLIELTDSGENLIHQTDTDITEKELQFLAAKEFISLLPAGDNEFYVRLDAFGLTYFEDKESRIIDYLLDNWIAFIALIVAIISLIRTF